MKSLKRVLIMAGGTGGHVFPGLAIADYLRAQQIDVHWLGTKQGIEAKIVPQAGYHLHYIAVSGIRGKGFSSLLLAPFKILRAFIQSIRVMNAIKPDMTIGMGGFVSGPGGVASWVTRHPLIIHEQNAIAGLTNKLLAIFSKKILEGFPNTFKNRKNVVTVGNPVRIEMTIQPSPEKRLNPPHSPYHLLILGGSLGAEALNKIVPKALEQLNSKECPLVIHQAGEKHYLATKALYAELGIQAEVKPFIDKMAEAYRWADMVLCRAGALTIAELCAVGIGSVLVPFPYAVDDHQTANAKSMVQNGAALCIAQADLTTEQLAAIVQQFSQSPGQRLTMAQAAYQLRHVNVPEKIYKICREVCH